MNDNTMEFLEDEKRRVIIACAMYKNDPVLFLQSSIEKEALQAKMDARGININKERDNDIGSTL